MSARVLMLALAACGALFLPPAARPAAAAEGTTAPQFDRAADEVLGRPEYSRRMPRERAAAPARRASWLSAFFHDMGRRLKALLHWAVDRVEELVRWLREYFGSHERDDADTLDWQRPVQLLLFVLLAAAASMLGVTLYRLWKRRARVPPAAALGIAATPDIRDEKVTADELPADQWFRLARGFMDRVEYRLALRALFLGGLACLAQDRHVSLARHKSNRDYLRELRRRRGAEPDVAEAFADNVRLLEGVWYGNRPATADTVQEFTRNHERILHDAQRF